MRWWSKNQIPNTQDILSVIIWFKQDTVCEQTQVETVNFRFYFKVIFRQNEIQHFTTHVYGVYQKKLEDLKMPRKLLFYQNISNMYLWLDILASSGLSINKNYQKNERQTKKERERASIQHVAGRPVHSSEAKLDNVTTTRYVCYIYNNVLK